MILSNFTLRFLLSGLICLMIFFHFKLAAQETTDRYATKKTKALYANLFQLSHHFFLFGHQETTAYGVQWSGHKNRSDVKDITGAMPAVYGWDIGKEDKTYNVDGVAFKDIKRLVKKAYRQGGVNTISWHGDNPVSLESSWDTTRAVVHILPGGKDHGDFVRRLDLIADFLQSCQTWFTKIPIIFRPFHEHNGDWFWWGRGHCTEEEYKALWRFTVTYLREERKLHHLLFAFSPDRSRMNMDSIRNSYLYGYPGDEYVDILGIDNYMDVGIHWNTKTRAAQDTDLLNVLAGVSDLAKEKNKVAAFSETGLEGIVDSTWFTQVILPPLIQRDRISIAYVMVWRNANETHHYAPYIGHPAEQDFLQFREHPSVLFASDLKNIYRKGKYMKK